MKQEVPYGPLSGLSEFHYHEKCVKLHGLKIILLYYLVHIDYVIVLSQFWFSVPFFSMLYIRLTTTAVSSETIIHILECFHLSVSIPSS